MQGTGILDPAYDMNQFYVVLLSLDLYKGRCWTTGVAIILLSTKKCIRTFSGTRTVLLTFV